MISYHRAERFRTEVKKKVTNPGARKKNDLDRSVMPPARAAPTLVLVLDPPLHYMLASSKLKNMSGYDVGAARLLVVLPPTTIDSVSYRAILCLPHTTGHVLACPCTTTTATKARLQAMYFLKIWYSL